ncbi:dihydrolipoamide acetyltransferase family protein [Pedobacter sandarakinus]|uniref:dihydrolipoamide acetyltransferase family protein n=1 Tax=Pedobacter sandarakinus TaxID=353156 RepID=UPI00224820C5|nr:dihydrolipoamide acetyltransferase family protein [Pedobacter sandarakinus]MCX2574253.1 dihydrolipoamide acetyltransferase family protein [Pedobacter sandarakinus]
MAQYELLLPKMGESVAEATVIKWVKHPGDMIGLDDTILEIATDKVDSEVPSPVAGRLVKQLFQENDVAQVGEVIAIIETEGDDDSQQNEAEPTAVVEDVKPEPIPGIEQLPEAAPVQKSDISVGDRFYSPLVKSIAAQENISIEELNSIKGSGAEGRLNKDDLMAYIGSKKGGAPGAISDDTKSEPKQFSNAASIQASANKTTTTSVSGGDEIIEMDRMRKLIADHMVMSKTTSPHVTSFVEADVTNMVLWRNKVKNSFEKRENEKITFTPIFVEAVAKAIKDFPMINVSVNGSQIIKKRDINIGMAAALPSGNLIVPVIKNADQLNLVGLTKAVNDLAGRARNSKLKPDETQGGTFTLTNVGSFGNVMGTPIINQPQVAILAVGAIKKKPAVLETEHGDVIAIRHMMFLSLSYDHRVVDGSLGGMFVRRVADYLEAWDLNREI